jgi:hypothetical protein
VYPKGDLRRMLIVLAAIAETRGATLVQIAARTGLDKKTVTRMVAQAREQAGVVVRKNAARYTIAAWGPVIRADGARLALKPRSVGRRRAGGDR